MSEQQRYNEINKELYKIYNYELEIMKCNIFKKNIMINGRTYIMLHNKLNEVMEKYIQTSDFSNYNIFDFKETINKELIQNPNLTDYTKISSLIQYIHLYCEEDDEMTELEKSKRYDSIFNIINEFNDFYYYFRKTYDNKVLISYLSQIKDASPKIKRLIDYIGKFTWTKSAIIKQIIPEYWMFVNESMNDLYIDEEINYPYLKKIAKLEYKVIHSQKITDEDFSNKEEFNEWYKGFINSWRYEAIIKCLNENRKLLSSLKPLIELEPYKFNLGCWTN